MDERAVYGMATPLSELADHCPRQTASQAHLFGPAAKLGRAVHGFAPSRIRHRCGRPYRFLLATGINHFAFATIPCGRDDEDAAKYECEGKSEKSYRRDDDRCSLPAEVLGP